MIETLALALSGLGLAASIIYYANILNNANKSRQKELIYQRITMDNTNFYKNWRTFINIRNQLTSFQDWMKYREENPEIYEIFTSITWRYNNLGLLLKNKMIDADLLFSVYSPNLVIWAWESSYGMIDVWRRSIDYPEHYGGFEFLYDEAKRLFPRIRSSGEYWEAFNEIVKTNPPLRLERAHI